MFGIATIAITAPLFFLIILRIDALRSMFYSLLLVSGSAYFIWEMESEAVVASAVLGLLGKEGKVLLKTIIPAVLYLVFTTVCAYLILFIFK